ncbi:MAG: amidase [Dehalococcoidia bacterium]|tara:strand:+ start:1582 stop:2916 length:1335 start_codon:yes stop_codon:yes gene_type:complete
MDLYNLTATEMLELMKSKNISATEVAKSIIDRYHALQDSLKAWVYFDEEAFLTQASAADQNGVNKSLSGVPVGLKDIYYTAGIPTEAGSKVYSGFVPEEDAATVSLLKDAGANIMGKTVTTEFACLDPSEAVNPWNFAHTPGGSSSGSAVAVASRMCPIAMGSQTVGSVLRPAAFNGIVGYKPTFGLVSRRGLVPVSWNLDTVGWLTRSVADAALVMDCLIGFDELDKSSIRFNNPGFSANLQKPPKKKVAYLKGYFSDGVESDITNNIDAQVSKLDEAGYDVEELNSPYDFQSAFYNQRLIMAVEAAAFHRENYASKADLYRPKLRAMLAQGLEYDGLTYANALEEREQFRFDVKNFAETYDLIITPSTPEVAPGDVSTTGNPMFQGPWTAIGFPAISIPSGISSNGMPIGMQIVASPMDDLNLLQAAHHMEQLIGFSEQPKC